MHASVVSDYQACYCEENIWRLCSRFAAPAYRATVVFISNTHGSVALFNQVAGSGPDAAVIWDYHVMLCVLDEGAWQVIDPDCRAGPVVDFATYVELTFNPLLKPELQAAFRLVPADEYRQTLRTDRRHMRDARGGWLSPPPPWPCIGEGSNLAEFADFHRRERGEILDLARLVARFGSGARKPQ